VVSGGIWPVEFGCYRYTTIWVIVVANKAPIPNIDNNIPNEWHTYVRRTYQAVSKSEVHGMLSGFVDVSPY